MMIAACAVWIIMSDGSAAQFVLVIRGKQGRDLL
jgi:hypothetical protein